MNICVFGASSNAIGAHYLEAGERLGAALARRGHGLVFGGGAKSAVWRQIVADALDLTLIQTENNDSSFGSAMCAGIYAGFFKDFDEASAVCKKETGRIVPVAKKTEKYAKLFVKYKKISAFLAKLCHES